MSSARCPPPRSSRDVSVRKAWSSARVRHVSVRRDIKTGDPVGARTSVRTTTGASMRMLRSSRSASETTPLASAWIVGASISTRTSPCGRPSLRSVATWLTFGNRLAPDVLAASTKTPRSTAIALEGGPGQAEPGAVPGGVRSSSRWTSQTRAPSQTHSRCNRNPPAPSSRARPRSTAASSSNDAHVGSSVDPVPLSVLKRNERSSMSTSSSASHSQLRGSRLTRRSFDKWPRAASGAHRCTTKPSRELVSLPAAEVSS